MDKQAKKPAARKMNPRRTFTIKEQMVSKLGPRGYGRLLDQLAKETA